MLQHKLSDNAGKQSQHNVQEILNMNEKGFSFTSMWPKVWTSGIISIAFDFANSCKESTSSGLQSAHTYITCLYLHTLFKHNRKTQRTTTCLFPGVYLYAGCVVACNSFSSLSYGNVSSYSTSRPLAPSWENNSISWKDKTHLTGCKTQQWSKVNRAEAGVIQQQLTLDPTLWRYSSLGGAPFKSRWTNFFPLGQGAHAILSFANTDFCGLVY